MQDSSLMESFETQGERRFIRNFYHRLITLLWRKCVCVCLRVMFCRFQIHIETVLVFYLSDLEVRTFGTSNFKVRPP